MGVPTNVVAGNGVGDISDDQLNSYVQTDQTLPQLRGFVGKTGMACILQGFQAPGDGGGGIFYWNVGNFTDDGANTIVPNAAMGQGAWLRMGPPIVNTPATPITSQVATLAALRALTSVPAQAVYVTGYYTPGDNGAGWFVYASGDLGSSDNGGTIIVDAVGHRWYREQEAEAISAAWFGCKGDATTDDFGNLRTAQSVAVNNGKPLAINGTVGQQLVVNSSLTLTVPVDFTRNGRLLPTTGNVITITGAIIAGNTQIFGGAGTFTISGPANVEVLAAWWGAVADNATNNTPMVNAAVLSLYNGSNVGGKIKLGAGTYLFSTVATVKGATTLTGAGRDATILSCGATDTTLLNFDATSSYAGLRDLFVSGNQTSSATQPLVTVNVASIGGQMLNCNIWGGNNALFTNGTDWDHDNCFIAGWAGANLGSGGANWYRRCKFDNAGAGTIAAAYLQGAYAVGSQVCENHFHQCDFSGAYTNSVFIADGVSTEAVTTFDGCVFSAGIVLHTQLASMFTGCEFGSTTFTLSAGSATVVGSWAAAAMAPAGVTAAGNINFT